MRKITPKQKTFAKTVVQKMLSGQKPTDAVKEIYGEKNLTESGVEKWADRVMSKPQVRREIVRILDGTKLSKQDLVLRLYKILNKPRGRDVDKLRGIHMALQMHGAFDPPEESKSSQVLSALQLFVKLRVERNLPVPEQFQKAVKELEAQENPAVVDALVVEPQEIQTNKGLIKLEGKHNERKK